MNPWIPNLHRYWGNISMEDKLYPECGLMWSLTLRMYVASSTETHLTFNLRRPHDGATCSWRILQGLYDSIERSDEGEVLMGKVVDHLRAVEAGQGKNKRINEHFAQLLGSAGHQHHNFHHHHHHLYSRDLHHHSLHRNHHSHEKKKKNGSNNLLQNVWQAQSTNIITFIHNLIIINNIIIIIIIILIPIVIVHKSAPFTSPSSAFQFPKGF